MHTKPEFYSQIKFIDFFNVTKTNHRVRVLTMFFWNKQKAGMQCHNHIHVIFKMKTKNKNMQLEYRGKKTYNRQQVVKEVKCKHQ